VGLADKMLEHLLRYLKIRDHSVLHRTDRDNVAGRTAKHFLCVTANRFDLVSYLVDRNYRRLRDNDAASLCIDERICGAEIDSEVAGKQTKQRLKCHFES